MTSVLDETKFESGAEVRVGCAGTCFGCEAQEAVKRIEKGVSDAKAAVFETLDDGKFAAERLLKRGRYALEDGVEETAHQIKRHPFGSLAIAFAAGAALGLLAIAPRSARK